MTHKRWTDKETDLLRELFNNNIKMETIIKILGRSKASINARCRNIKIKRNKVVDSKLPFTDKTNRKHFTNQSNLVIGGISEWSVFISLEQRGWGVFKPIIEGNRSDCIIKHYETGKTYKIQIKTGTYSQRYDCFHTQLKTSEAWKAEQYNKEDLDFFIVRLDKMNVHYIIPFEDSLRIPTRPTLTPHRRKQVKRSRYNHLDTEQYKDKWDLIKA
tara:strand:+ start:60 stop:704 length:645 start_codon:yes stop_codon:yes gene_type:complete